MRLHNIYSRFDLNPVQNLIRSVFCLRYLTCDQPDVMHDNIYSFIGYLTCFCWTYTLDRVNTIYLPLRATWSLSRPKTCMFLDCGLY